MGNVMQIATEALAVFYFDFSFAFLLLSALSKVAARDGHLIYTSFTLQL